MDQGLAAAGPPPRAALARPAAPPAAAGARPLTMQVLLSTYNGARYLPELLESLDGQLHRSFHLQVRDDGSTDGTLEILDAYRGPATVERGAHVGVPESFFRLLQDAEPEADLFGFCDQDDVWLPHKMAAAAEFMARTDPAVPALYCSALIPVDAGLHPLMTPWRPLKPLGFRNALVENRVSGCTLVFNRAARALLTRRKPRVALMHDHWAYLVVSAFGIVHFDPRPSLLYRQHGHNTVGVPRGWLSRARGIRQRRGMSPLFAQAEEFRALYGASLDPALSAALDRFLASRDGLANRLGYALSADTYRQFRSDDLAHRLMIALGLF
jgi:glycosyltransferase involved in cell wall biosynthesis